MESINDTIRNSMNKIYEKYYPNIYWDCINKELSIKQPKIGTYYEVFYPPFYQEKPVCGFRIGDFVGIPNDRYSFGQIRSIWPSTNHLQLEQGKYLRSNSFGCDNKYWNELQVFAKVEDIIKMFHANDIIPMEQRIEY